MMLTSCYQRYRLIVLVCLAPIWGCTSSPNGGSDVPDAEMKVVNLTPEEKLELKKWGYEPYYAGQEIKKLEVKNNLYDLMIFYAAYPCNEAAPFLLYDVSRLYLKDDLTKEVGSNLIFTGSGYPIMLTKGKTLRMFLRTEKDQYRYQYGFSAKVDSAERYGFEKRFYVFD
jgi:hypothetical protein